MTGTTGGTVLGPLAGFDVAGFTRDAATNLARSAPLAQSAEHFHGKEGVYGSSP